jgi:carbon-monoxide dehydrogenase medium subunit
MIPNPVDYVRATSLDDALTKLSAGDGGKILAGGHSLLPLMKLRLSEPRRLIDIGALPELRGIRDADEGITVGAAVTHHEVATSPVLVQRCPVLAEAAATIGDQQVRNRGTIGGSVAHADPSADYPAVLLALDAEIHLAGPRGRRAAKAQSFFRDLFTVDLGADEIIVSVQVPAFRSAAYAKLYQRASHFAIVGVAAALAVSGGNITTARIGLTGAAPYAQRLTSVEAALAGRPASDATIESAVQNAAAGVKDVNDDLHASAEYRRAMIVVFTKRALKAAMARAK